MFIKRIFSGKIRVLAHLTLFLLKNAFKRREMLVFALNSLVLHNSMRLHHSESFIALKPIMCIKSFFLARNDTF